MGCGADMIELETPDTGLIGTGSLPGRALRLWGGGREGARASERERAQEAAARVRSPGSLQEAEQI